MLFRLRPLGVKPAASPSLYVPLHYGSSDPQRPTSDSSPPATPAQKQEAQIVIGYLLYYGRCVDGRVLPAACALASVLTTAMQRTMLDLERLLGFVAAHRDGRKIFRPSDMLLDILTDASYLSWPKAGSADGSFHHLARGHDPDFNAPISVHSTGIPIVCSLVQEAEYSGTFAAAKIGTGERQVLEDLGYPQPPTVIHRDNEVAVGLAQKSVKQKLAKSCDMRLHWLQDRMAQRQFIVRHIPGAINVADFFTKLLPVHRHTFLAPFIALDVGCSPFFPRLNRTQSN
jgi:hypothetical protein